MKKPTKKKTILNWPVYSFMLFYLLISGLSAADQNISSDRQGFAGRLIHDVGYAVKTTASDFRYIYTSPARINSKYALWLGGIAAVGGILFAYDQEIYDAIHRNKDSNWYKPILDTGEFCEPAGYMGDSNKFIFGSLFIGYITGYDPLVELSADLLESYAVAISGKLVKTFSGRYGPGKKVGPRFFKFNDGASFPSGHSMNIMQMANILTHHIDFKPFRIGIYGAASTVLLQRITSDHHWPSDVYTGAVFGWVISHELLKLKKNRRMNVTPVTFNKGDGAGMIMTYNF